VVYDEIDLPAGRVRLKFGGGHAGHNGVRSIIEHVGADFWRIRLGVGRPSRGQKNQVIGHVLNRASADDEKLILEGVGAALDIVPVIIEQGAQRAQNQLHTAKPENPDDSETKER
jgi:PTH1 family peptidyl-tRNA hydrolase